ncbi:MAG: GNAT family N-acetyltransferase [Alicyclobacillus sp.]|nr:GNAT family N-acetyltransferase [Alicyclobacillus sp.]
MGREILRDGRAAELRVAGANEEDIRAVADLFRRASPESLYFRFFHAVREVDEEWLVRTLQGNGEDALTVVCEVGGRVVGVGSYNRVDDAAAEVGLLVEDAEHGHGIGTLLLEHLADAAWQNGFRRLEARVLGENRRMLEMLGTSGYQIRTADRTMQEVRMELILQGPGQTRYLHEKREKFAVRASLRPFFEPQSIAVVTVGKDGVQSAGRWIQQIRGGGFNGLVYRAHCRRAGTGMALTWPSHIGQNAPDCAWIFSSSDAWPEVVKACVARGIRAIVILSTRAAGSGANCSSLNVVEAEQELAMLLRGSGTRLLGPGSIGVANPARDFFAAFRGTRVPAGDVAVAVQSGGIGLALARQLDRSGLGLAAFADLGDALDVSVEDLLEFWEDDARVRFIALELKSVTDPVRFLRVTSRIARKKPVTVLCTGRSDGRPEPLPVRGSVPIGDPKVGDLFSQSGVIKVESVEEWAEVLALLASRPTSGTGGDGGHREHTPNRV